MAGKFPGSLKAGSAILECVLKLSAPRRGSCKAAQLCEQLSASALLDPEGGEVGADGC
jgi:hypothetical protein